MTMKLLDKSKVKVGKESVEAKREEYVISDKNICGIGSKEVNKNDVIICTAGKGMNMLSADKILKCERAELGTSSNCALCQGTDDKIFVKCKNKWADY
jgi:hypothetical protein